MKKAVQYGAGNIGRGFIGQLFSESGYEVVFIDVNKEFVDKMNQEREYPIKIVSEQAQREIIVQNIRAVDGMNIESISGEISDADIMATAVGVNILPRIVPNIAAGLKKRWSIKNFNSLNIIICENMLNADKYLEKLIKEELSEEEKVLFDKYIGLVEASIGRMVPIMTKEMQEGNILKVWVEEYGQLPVDKAAFRGLIPEIAHMIPFSPFEYYIQRKLFIHNMGHALVAYLGYYKKLNYIYEAIGNTEIKTLCKNAMKESAKALSAEHGVALEEILEHVDDLIYRFGNRYLGDTIERVGKDPIRKLSSSDRLAGAAKLCKKHGINPVFICIGIAAGLCFDTENDPSAVKVQSMINTDGLDRVLDDLCGIDDDLKKMVKENYRLFKKQESIENIVIRAVI